LGCEIIIVSNQNKLSNLIFNPSILKNDTENIPIKKKMSESG
jgi:hypothetical protein